MTPRRNLSLAVAYLLLAAAGGLALVVPPRSVESSAGGAWAFVWAAFMAAGGLLAGVAAVRGRWPGEFLGLLLIIGVWAVYGLAAAGVVVATRDWSRAPGSLALLAVAWFFAWRWRQVRDERRSARHVAAGRHKPPGGE